MRSSRVVILLILISACAVFAGGQTLTPIYERLAAPELSLPDLHGKTVTLADYRGEVVVVNFWASWCPPCVSEMQSMQRGSGWLAQHRGRFIAINMGEEPDVVAKFLTGRDFTIPVLLDSDGKISSRWGVRRLPATYILDTRGRVAYQALGAREWDNPALLVPLRSLAMEK
ncbi:MAG: TlpA family protein disulfide reductase [Chromatiaceae bacterium]|nr:TlpA family protein disulfide reductase [Chromatiaceae bacterium]MCP5447148.1 TlpA family protein disulfide reductase [Chromatiaceae bacterium]